MATRRFRKQQVVPRIVNSVTGSYVDNTDPENPVIHIPPGSGDLHWIHNQSTVSNHWICPHPLQKVVAVTTQDLSGNTIEGEIIVNDGIVVEVLFIDPFAGSAFFN